MSDLEEIIDEMFDCISKTDYSGEYMDYFAERIEAARKSGTCKMEKEHDGLARGWWRCSECGGVAPAPDKFSYCPYCGRRIK